ncbi:DNA topology modulation protein FlaR [Candidatus Woesearchaeota archaeon]|nr:DNA topology modulation protein FlaR [Candidatus Woesearchaeota archaeon]
MRIRIIGGPGSGKTYLGKMLSDKLGTTHHDLDDIFWDNTKNSYSHRMPENKREKLLKNILRKRSWIIEGVYYEGWAKLIDKDAEITVLIVPSLLKARYRITRRFIKGKLGLEQTKKESIANFIGLWKWLTKYYHEKLVEIRQMDVKEFSSADEAYEWAMSKVKL